MSPPRRVVITGLGLSCALGIGVERCWPRLLAGDSGISTISLWDASEYQAKVAASFEYEDSPLAADSTGVRKGARAYLDAVGEALAAAELDQPGFDRRAIGLATGTSVNNFDIRQLPVMMDFLDEAGGAVRMSAYADKVVRGQAPRDMFVRQQGELISTLTMRRYGLGGPSFVIDTACAASAHAIGEALRLVRRGNADIMIAGGAAALVRPVHIIAFERLRALTPNPNAAEASRPFDRNRDGFVMGEAAGALVVESLDSARRRGAPVLAELAGYGATSTAYTMTDPSPAGEAEGRAMGLAIEDAGASPADIGYIAAHGTSTPKGDVAETLAIRRIFGCHAERLLISSIKGQVGHTISAAGVCNAVAAIKAIETGWIPPTATLQCPDPECDLNYVPRRAQQVDVDYALTNSFAFGGQNVALVMRRFHG